MARLPAAGGALERFDAAGLAGLAFGLIAVTAFAALGARRSHIPHSIFLVLLGLAIGFLPGMPRIALRPDLVLSLRLPPLR